MNDLEESSMTMREVNEPLSGRVSEFEKCDILACSQDKVRQIFWFRFFSAKKGTRKKMVKAKILEKILMKKY